MRIIRSFDELKQINTPLVCAIGTFDGIHRGHTLLINKMQETGKNVGAKSMVITFDKHPLSIIEPTQKVFLLMEDTYRCEYFNKMDIDYLFCIHLDEEFIQMEANSFLVLLENSQIQHIFVGADFTYGKNGIGTPYSMSNFFKDSNIEVHIVELLTNSGINSPVISSTAIRNYIKEGCIEKANTMLGRAFGLYSTVIYGDQRGRLLGFPTVNFLWPSSLICPPDGVYVNRLYFDGRWYNGIGNIGNNPTFENQFHRFEIHILDFEGDLYGRKLYVEFLTYLRKELKFDTLEDLIDQMSNDKNRAIAYLREKGYID